MKAPFDYETAKQMFDFIEEKVVKHGCDGTYRFTEEWLLSVKHFPESLVHDVLNYLDSHGGYCDCEVLMNASDERHWRDGTTT